MDVDSLAGVLLILSAALLLILTAAATAAGVFAARGRSRQPAAKAGTRPEHLHQFTSERERMLSELVLARTTCLVTGTVAAEALVMRRSGITLRPATLTAVIAILVAAALEAVPRIVVTHNPERWARFLRPVTEALRAIFLVPAYVTDLPARAVLRLAPFRPPPPEDDDEEEIVRLVEMEESQGGIEEDEAQMIRAVFELGDTPVREVMVPRIDVVAVDASTPLHAVAEVIRARGFSRVPVYEGSIDNVVGIIYAKDVLAHLAGGGGEIDLRTLARPPYFVPESKRIDELLSELRTRKVHIAIVVDEYGGTAGLVTFEDLMEQIVGEIEDEYDHAEPTIERIGESDAVVDARESVDVLKDLFDVEVESDEFDTVGGLIIHRLGKIPSVNDTVQVDGLNLQVLSVTGRRVRKVRISRLTPSSAVPAQAK